MENRYKCPICNTPINESMFCVKCCSKWTKIDDVATRHSELIEAAQKILKDSFVTEFDLMSFYNKEKNKEQKKDANQLADEHWGYIEALLKAHEEEFNIKQIEFHYKSAFIHGYKHAMEDK